jgi:hypothetical protein
MLRASLLPPLLTHSKGFGRSPFLDHCGSKTQYQSPYGASVGRGMDQLRAYLTPILVYRVPLEIASLGPSSAPLIIHPLEN